ncbi:MAG: TrkH family potassium uptake protein [Bacteroidales bacterium]|nr:TrkH family potassium uptake protein [Bacteroidales bacterium]MCF0200312.1 TrkH family potassium uptake protein [Bacteroidales bacterium]MCF0201210.1 TrkH family potassium uptake protein [Bacteroidales bacterium]
MKSKLFGILLFIESLALLVSAAVAGHYNVRAGETDVMAFLNSAAFTGLVGLVLYVFGILTQDKKLRLKDTYLVVGLSWVLFSAFGMLPFILHGTLDKCSDAFFETMSGFTTTGSSVIDVESQPHGILFWRSLTQWLGGLGVVVFTLAFIPSVAKSSKKSALYAAETTGLGVEKLAPKMQNTARNLWVIYIILTVSCGLAYWHGGMGLFDSVCHAMTTIATGGFSTHGDSIKFFHSAYLEYACAFFMLLSGISFSMYYFAFTRRFEAIRKNEELKWYLLSVVIFTAVFVGLFYFWGDVKGTGGEKGLDFEGKVRTAFFHVSALVSNTGFQGQCSNYELWGKHFTFLTLFLMVIGGCAGSTSGGVKLIRLIVVYKYVKMALKELVHPTGMFSIKVSNQPIEGSAIRHVCVFFSLFILLLMVNMVALTATGMELDNALTAFLACFSNYGLGTGVTGPSSQGGFSLLPNAAKWILSFDMLVGRLEIFTIFMLFTPAFWKAK